MIRVSFRRLLHRLVGSHRTSRRWCPACQRWLPPLRLLGRCPECTGHLQRAHFLRAGDF